MSFYVSEAGNRWCNFSSETLLLCTCIMCALSVHVIRFRGVGGVRSKEGGNSEGRKTGSILQAEEGRIGNTISQGDGN